MTRRRGNCDAASVEAELNPIDVVDKSIPGSTCSISAAICLGMHATTFSLVNSVEISTMPSITESLGAVFTVGFCHQKAARGQQQVHILLTGPFFLLSLHN